MGDTGSMLLGLLLAYAPISSIDSLPEANLTNQLNRYPVILPLLLPAALLVIPYGDMLLAVVRRTRAGRSPFAPDRKHLHHRLLEIGHSQRASVLIMYLWAAAFSGTVVWLSIQKTVQLGNSNHHGAPIAVFVIITVIAVAVLLLLSMPRLRWWQRPRLAPAADADTGGAGVSGPGAAEPATGSTVLETPGLAGPGLVGVTAGPAPSGTPPFATPPFATPPFATPPAADVPGHRGRAGGAPAEPVRRTPPFATSPPPTAPSATLSFATPPFAAPPSTGLPSTGLPSTGLPSTRRSVIGTPPPAVSGQPPIGRTTHHGATWRPETWPPSAADGSKTEQDGLP
jgi:UDP-GlcNAc:undecaprenyl-phosphate/decaprenyl-phosphate GlcNAc-1-phosphate transferase